MFNCNFTYSFYQEMIELIKQHGYRFSLYNDRYDGKKCILRHDIDFDIKKSLDLAILENKLGVKSTFFVLLKTDFYNPLSKKSLDLLKRIISLGHDIGLHFDEKSYDDSIDIAGAITTEAEILGKALDYKIATVSMHRPSKKTLESNYQIPNMVNSYSKEFFSDYKYISDSRRRWREDPIQAICCGSYQRLHILTHAFWWNVAESDIKRDLLDFIDQSRSTRIDSLKDNLTDFNKIIDQN